MSGADQTLPSAPSTQSILAGLIRAFMKLETEQVVVYNQKWKIPSDGRLYVSVMSIGPNKAYGATVDEALSAPDANGMTNLVETIITSSREYIGIDIYSASQDAVERKEELLACFAGTLAQQTAEKYALKFGRIPSSFVDISEVEGTQRLNRFHFSFAVLRSRSISTVIESFDKFQKNPSLLLNP